jgi:hypothetical protein
MNDEFEYYFIGRVNNDQYPLLIADTDCPAYLRKKEYIENPQRMFFCLGKPIPKKPKMVDYHSTPKSVISKKIFDVLDEMKIKGIQLIPATITGKNNELYEDYWYIHIINRYPALDREKSIYEWDDFIKVASPLEKVVLNEAFLKTIPLEERLVFYLAENGVEQLFHKSVVDAIMAMDPEGVVFYNVKEWEDGMQFD